MKEPVEGILLINKPEGWVSFDVVRKLKPFLKGTKVGYLGILDPMAKGVLPILLGKATRLAPFLEEGEKVYEGTIRLGITTDTQDRDGKPVKVIEDLSQFDLSSSRIQEVFKGFEGRIKQVPPMFSAKKYRGVPLYKYARKGVEVPRDFKEVEIYEIKLKKVELPFVEFFLRCSKGTYVRTLAHDIGEALGCGGHLYSLTRLRNGPFSLEDAKDLEEVLRLAEEGRLSEVVWDLNKALGYLNSLELEGKNLYRILHGGFVFLEDKELKEGLVRLVDGEGKLVAIGLVNQVGKEWMVKPLKVLRGRA